MPQPKSKEQIDLERLWRFEGNDAEFWRELMLVFARQVDAASGAILVKPVNAEEGQEETSWSILEIWPASEETKQRFSAQYPALSSLAEETISGDDEGFQSTDVVENAKAGAVELNLESDELFCVAVFLRYGSEEFFEPSARIVKLMADSPLIFGADPITQITGAKNKVQSHHQHTLENPLSSVVNLGLVMNSERRFLASAMMLCNELATRFEADQVSLGWKKGNYIKVIATNHAGKIEGKMEATQLLASAMEECVDQDDEITWPGSEAARAIYRDHETYARKEGIKFLASVPIRSGTAEPVASITLERIKPFDESDLNVLRLISDLVSQRLVDLKQSDRWFGARWASASVKGLKKIVGVEHTLLKVSMLAVSGILAFLALFPWDYRIEAPFTLKSEEVYQLPAPFEGYIDEVHVRVGDAVKANDPLVVLDSTELKLQASELSALIERYIAEAKLARGESNPTEVHIAVAKAHETKATLEKIQFQIGMAKVIAPVDSFVVEGDLRERIGTPVSRGEALLQLSKLEGMYAELHVSEKDIHRVDQGSSGLVAFAGRPKLKFPVSVTQIEPIAIAEESGNVLIARTAFDAEAKDWWRPGMSGVAKIDCGQRSLLWIFTHRAIDYLRLKLWF